MKFAFRMLALATVSMMAPGMAQEPGTTAPASPLPGWMAGCWMTAGEGRRTEECWTVPRGTMMLGSSHTFQNGETRWFEHMRIVREAEGLVFIAQPGGVPPTRFAMAAASASESGLSFVNAGHDYPQRVRYFLDADGALVGEISMLDGSRLQRWVYRRAG